MRPLVICGAGGFGREVVQIVAAVNARTPQWELLGVVDDAPSDSARQHLDRLGVPLLGSVADLAGLAEGGCAIIAIGAAGRRSAIAAANPGTEWATLVHPDTTIGADVTLGPGTVVAAGSRLSTNITIGGHGHLDHNVTVGHDTSLGSCVRLNPQACVSGAVTIGDRVLVGANATVLQGLSVGQGATVGAGAVVVHDVPAETVVKGVPAR